MSEPEPDIALLELRDDFYFDNLPRPEDTYLLIEVAVSTLDYDKNVKLQLYASAAIPEYWIVDVNNAQIFIHTQPEGNQYKKTTIATLEDTIYCTQFPDISFGVKNILG